MTDERKRLIEDLKALSVPSTYEAQLALAHFLRDLLAIPLACDISLDSMYFTSGVIEGRFDFQAGNWRINLKTSAKDNSKITMPSTEETGDSLDMHRGQYLRYLIAMILIYELGADNA